MGRSRRRWRARDQQVLRVRLSRTNRTRRRTGAEGARRRQLKTRLHMAHSPPRFARLEVTRDCEYKRHVKFPPLAFVSRVNSVTPAGGGRWRMRGAQPSRRALHLLYFSA
ncbi:MAG: hypothetical protein DMF84_07940 [Acidobacteria bacterium]|nr:MAG: hypothetical protein DMF84_07940 [Acidobacteriota bacterium]